MHLHTLMIYEMLFHNCKCPLKIMVFSKFGKKIGATDFHTTKNEFWSWCPLKIDGKFIRSIGQANNAFEFFQIRSAYWKRWSSKFWSIIFRNVVQSNISNDYNNKFDYKSDIHRLFRANSGHSLGAC